ncbi:MAG: hypothetical protein KatS3mg103_0427 [Phycisphaerales bacterium]|nr:MAG: hypothetical protein KatS3mg103_0427 [Phycisphaerales bacterium]
MDERQGQVKERAGLDESRINEEFRDFLVKWGPRLLIAVALVALALSGRRWLNQQAERRVDEAFVQLALATGSGSASPDTLLSLASQYEDVRAVADLATLAAAEAYLAAVRRGVVIGAQPDELGRYPQDELLDADLRASYLEQAEQALVRVAESKQTPDPLVVRALMGLAAVAEARGRLDQARSFYQRAIERDQAAGLGVVARVAEQRLADLDELAAVTDLPSDKQLPAVAQATPDADADEPDPDDPFGLGTLDLGDLGSGLLEAPDQPRQQPADPPTDQPDQPGDRPSDQPSGLPSGQPEPPADDPGP